MAAIGALLLIFLVLNVDGQTPTTELRCELTDAVKAELRVFENGTWHVTEELYGEHGIQKIVDCAEEGDVISLDPSLTIRPSSRIIIRRDVTILGGQRLDGRPPTKRTVFICPSGEGLFLLGGGFTLIDAVIKDCHLTEEHGVAGIIEADFCIQSSSKERKVHLSDVLFENNTNLGGSVGLVVRDPPCHGEVELLNVAFKDNVYLNPSVLARENTLTNVRVVANRRTPNEGQETTFFHFPANSSSVVTNMNATDNTNAHVLYVEQGKLNVSSSLFYKNAANWSACVRVLSSSLTMRHTHFLNNTCDQGFVAVTAEEASSVYFSSCTFVGNVDENYSGGIVLASIPREVRFSSCEFIENVMKNSRSEIVELRGFSPRANGEEIRQMTSANFTHCNFQSNNGTDHVLRFSSAYGDFWIWNTTFSDNSVWRSSVAIVPNVRTKDVSGECSFAETTSEKEATFKVEDSNFEKNRGFNPDSAFLIADEQVQVKLRNSHFLGNQGDQGAAVYVEKAYSVRVDNCMFTQNQATYDGGAMHVEMVVANFSVIRSNFTNNMGRYGGAIHTQRKINVQDSNFQRNTAVLRGGAINLDCNDNCDSYVQRSTFTENAATTRSGGALHVTAGSWLTIATCTFHKNEAKFGGGISFFLGMELAERTVIDSTFTQNNAEVGGAIALLNNVDAARLEEKAYDNISYGVYLTTINNTKIMNNTAMRSGGGIFAESPFLIKIDGTPVKAPEKAFDCQTIEAPPSDAFGKNFENNTVDGGYLENLASLSVDFCVYAVKGGLLVGTISEDRKYVLPRWRSGEDFPVLHVVMYDQLGNNVLPTVNKDLLRRSAGHEPEEAYLQPASVILSPKTKNGTTSSILLNNVTKTVFFGSVNISVGNPFVNPGQYQLTLLVEGFEQRNVTVEVQVRDCTINEESDLDDTFCRPCDSNQYNFHSADTEGKCALCPENADCATEFTFPRMGYWNAFPCSNHIERCVYEEACNFTRPNMLEGMTESETPCVFNDDVIEQYQSSQCAAEYEGPLCGSCLHDAGRLGSFVCTPCMSEFLAVVGQVGVLVFQLILALLPMRETLNAESELLEDRMTTLSFARRTRRSIRSPGSYRSFRGGPISRSRRSAGAQAGTARNSTTREVSRAKRRFLGTLKITINLLQTVAIAASLDVSWNFTAISFLRTWDSMGVAASVGASLFLDCLLSDGRGAPRTVKRQIIVALLPELVALVISAFFLLRELLGDKDWNRLLRRVILAHIVVGYNSYLSLVKIAVDAFNCVRVHDGIRLEDIDATHRYWISDTTVECFRGSHLAFTLAISAPLLLFAVLFPVLLAVLLERARGQDKLSSKWTQETMGFLFIVFEEEYVYWDCLILLRKAVLSVIIVFAYKLGGNLQGLLVVAVLVIALFLQTHFNPFSQDLGNLNVLESVSLLVSFFTFLSGLVLDSKRSDGVLFEGVLTAVLLSSNILLFLTLLFTLAQSKLEQFRLELEVMQVDGSDGAFYVVVWSYLAYQLARLRGRIEQPDSVDNEAETEPQRSIELSGV